MIGPKEKEFDPVAGGTPTSDKFTKEHLRHLPKYIVYRAALLREKLILTYLVGTISGLFGIYFVISRVEVSTLYDKLRVKEYILAPGVLDFTTATPQSVPDSYVSDAVNEFLSTLGNVNATNIDEQYSSLIRFMSDPLKIQFEADARDWIAQVKTEDLAQIFKIKNKDIVSNQQGLYRVTAFVKADFYAEAQYLGGEDQVVEMKLKLVPPERGIRWYLQIIEINWSKLDKFKKRESVSKPVMEEEHE